MILKSKIYGLTPQENKVLSQEEALTRLFEINSENNGGRFISLFDILLKMEKVESFRNSDIPRKRILERIKAKTSREAANRRNGEVVRHYHNGTSYQRLAILTEKGFKDLDPFEKLELQEAKLDEIEIQLKKIVGSAKIQSKIAEKSRLLPNEIRKSLIQTTIIEEILINVRNQKTLLEKRKKRLKYKEAERLLASRK